MRPEQIAALILMVGSFVAIVAWVWRVWPVRDPTDDLLFQAHDRRRSRP